jgi:protocatechuate 3,4-dioxygenase beta subunit
MRRLRTALLLLVPLALAGGALLCCRTFTPAPAPRAVATPPVSAPRVAAVEIPRAPAPQPPGPQLVGHVVDYDHHAVPGAKVTLDGTRTTLSDDDGEFAFPDVTPGLHHASAENGQGYGEDEVTLDRPAQIELLTGPPMVVHVVDLAGAPIAGAKVQALYTRQTDRDGRAWFRRVSKGLIAISVEAAGFMSRERGLTLSDDPRHAMQIEIKLAPSVLIGGIVLDQDGSPVPGAEIYAHSHGLSDFIKYDNADDQGHFRLDGFGPGPIELSAWSAFDVPAPGPPIVIGKTPRVERGGTVAGIAVDPQGHPLAGVHVSTTPAPGDGQITDDSGRFEQLGVKPGKAFVDASTATLGTQTKILFMPRHGRVEVRLVMTESSLAGTVTTSDGTPAAGARVIADGPIDGNDVNSHQLDAGDAGQFDFHGLPPGTYSVWFTRSFGHGHPSSPIKVRTGTRNLALVVPDIASVHGRVVQDGKPVEFFGVSVAGDAPVPQHTRDGRFVLDDVEQSTFAIAIVGPTFQRRVIENVTVTPDRLTNLGDIRVTAGRIVRGRVVDASGAPVAGAAVVVQPGAAFATTVTLGTQNAGMRGVESDQVGAFELAGLPDDTAALTIQASAPGHGIAPPRPVTGSLIELVLAATGSITGTVVNDPPGYIWHIVRVTSVTDGHSYETSTKDGEFAIEQLSPGDYQAVLDDDDRTATTFHVAPGQATTVAMTRL